MEKIFQNNSCRFCRKEYSNEKKSKEPRLNLFKNKFNHKSLVTTLEGLGVFVKENSLYSDTICRPCFNKIKILENAQLIKEKWIKLMNDQSSKRPRDDIDTIEDEGQSKKIRSESMETPSSCLDAEGNSGDTLNDIKRAAYDEFKSVEKTSRMKNADVENLLNLNDIKLAEQIDSLCPNLSSALKGALGSINEDSDEAKICRSTCYGALFKSRYGRSRACVVTARNDQLLIAAGVKKRAFTWFNKLGISNSYKTALNKNAEMAVDHDKKTLEWKSQHEVAYLAKQKIVKEQDVTFQEATQQYNVENEKPTQYQIIGDNLDFELTARHQGKDKHNKSVHWFNFMAVKYRTVDPHANDDTPVDHSFDIFPGEDTFKMLTENYKVLLARSIVSFLPSFKFLKKHVCGHIPHQFQDEMSKETEFCPLGLDFHNENTSSEIVQILWNIQKHYVPQVKLEDDTIKIVSQLMIGGDQLTEERIYNAQKGFLDGRNKYEQLQGLLPKCEDWHLKRTLYEVKEKIFRKNSSGSEPGTTQWSLNVSHMSNAKKGPRNSFNAYKEFSDVELDAQIVVATMTHFGMQDINDDPIPDEIKSSTSDKDKFEWLYGEIENIIKRYTIQYNSHLEKEIKARNDQKVSSKTAFFCYMRCGEVFLTKKERNGHEIEQHNHDRNEKENYRQSYQKSLLSFNLFLRNINDAIREGDGGRLMSCYKIALLYFRCYGHPKYALAVLRLLATIKLQPKRGFYLTWERFVNSHGIKGRNISLDLKQEQNNNFLKELLKVLRSNMNEKNADRISKAMNNIRILVEETEKNFGINAQRSSHNKAKTLKDVQHLADEIFKNNPFDENVQDGNEYPSFPKFNGHLLDKLDTTETLKWANKKEQEIQSSFLSSMDD